MADTHDSGSCALTGMGVQVPLSAPGVVCEYGISEKWMQSVLVPYIESFGMLGTIEVEFL